MAIRVGILTVSDRSARGEREDRTHLALRELLGAGPYEVVAYEVVPDEPAQIRRVLRLWADRDGLELILTNGGTGLGPRDHTPEATREVIEKEVPGLAELMRLVGLRSTPMAALSRAVAGVRGRSLIVNLPGSPKGARESLAAVLPAIPHAIEVLTGRRIEGGAAHE
ncbi:MogA/MoaB family molybdenum cofactor biosynthesis protein [Marinithermus hydrothermalis]|uniref:Molybdenum cofactor synthesis domain protein n=1 Tax=Marinithermus hydrothermalis (strain DSM 14884 / JCM 11576 / T1) TaxID=869210 RepID=F2NKR3_MARHT|nr:MogA/MoaB family molybdenum cofactor biosynthesis protein [Marinithermus hydrothermalis]AEB10826.1 molybdenum cofactor synthesis domain protein [Marinithermus hydrothermalis DSM 14884]